MIKEVIKNKEIPLICRAPPIVKLQFIDTRGINDILTKFQPLKTIFQPSNFKVYPYLKYTNSELCYTNSGF